MDTETESAPEPSLRDTISGVVSDMKESTTSTAPESTETDTEGDDSKSTSSDRDDKGRYLAPVRTITPKPRPGQTSKTIPGQVAAKQAQTDGTPHKGQAQVSKGPQSWALDARERWADVPAEVQREVLRVDKEARAAMEQSAQARHENEGLKQFQGAFNQVINPYMPMLKSQGADPLRTVDNLLATSHALYTAPVPHKAALVANIMRQFGILVEALAEAIDRNGNGTGNGQPQGQPQQQFDPNQFAQQIEQRIMGKFEQQRGEAISQRSVQEVERWAEGKEFLDVPGFRDFAAALMTAAAESGQALSLDQAYELARNAHPEVSAVLKQRSEREAVANGNASTQRARAASTSIRSQPTGITPQPSSESLRDDVQNAVARLRSRR